ncbi:YjfB family protein [Syntrophomonas curvata]
MDTLAIAGLAMSMQAAQLQQMAAMQVMKMSMDSTRQSAQAITDMMKVNTQLLENSVQPHLGSTIDVLA